jgi:hypothetical protein
MGQTETQGCEPAPDPRDEQAKERAGEEDDAGSGGTGRRNPAGPALDEDMTAARDIAGSTNPESAQKPIVSINGRDVDAHEIDKAA